MSWQLSRGRILTVRTTVRFPQCFTLIYTYLCPLTDERSKIKITLLNYLKCQLANVKANIMLYAHRRDQMSNKTMLLTFLPTSVNDILVLNEFERATGSRQYFKHFLEEISIFEISTLHEIIDVPWYNLRKISLVAL